MSDEFAIPDGMIETCARQLVHIGWSHAECDVLLVAYRQYVELVRQLEDWNALLLYPPLCVDLVWFAHAVQYKEHYLQACQDYCGGNIIRHHSTAMDPATESSRRATTQIAVQARFDKNAVSPEIWSLVDGHRDGHASKPTMTPPLQHPMRQRAQQPHSIPNRTTEGNDKVTLILTTHDGPHQSFRIPRCGQIGNLFEIFSQRSGIPLTNLAFLFNRHQIDPSQTPQTLKLRNNDTITVATVVTFLVHCPQLQQVLPIRMKRSTLMGIALDRYRQRNRIPISNVVRFFTASVAIGRNDTPKKLELEDGTQIIALVWKK